MVVAWLTVARLIVDDPITTRSEDAVVLFFDPLDEVRVADDENDPAAAEPDVVEAELPSELLAVFDDEGKSDVVGSDCTDDVLVSASAEVVGLSDVAEVVGASVDDVGSSVEEGDVVVQDPLL